MRKLLSVLLVLFLAVPVLGLSEGSPVDLKALDDGELLALLDAVQAERLARLSFASFVLQPGEYRIGVDVPAGAFRVEHTGSSYLTDLAVFDDPGDSIRSFFAQVAMDGEVSTVGKEVGRLVLPDGGLLKVTSGSARFFAETGGIVFE